MRGGGGGGGGEVIVQKERIVRTDCNILLHT